MSPRSVPKTLGAPFLVHAGETPVPLWWRIGDGEVAAASLAAPGRTDVNEDALAVFPLPGALVLVVVDGVGGSSEAAEAARILLEELASSLTPTEGDEAENLAGGPDALRGRILDALEGANARLLSEYRDAAAVVAIAVVASGRVRTIHVGDAAVLLFGQRGKLKYQTTAHSPVGFALEAGWIGEREALTHEDRHLISNAVGSRDMRIEIGPWISMGLRDRVLLASDGLFDNLSLDETIEACRCGPLGKAARHLVEWGRRRMERPTEGKPSKPDDLSLVLYSQASGSS